MTRFLGRQPIIDARGSVHGYELLYRHDDVVAAVFVDENRATEAVAESAILEWGLNTLVGAAGVAFVNVSADFVRRGAYLALPSDRVVLEIDAVALDDSVTEALFAASQTGYRIAVEIRGATTSRRAASALPIVDVVKIDTLAMAPAELAAAVANWRGAVPFATLLAHRVETRAAFDHCQGLGFDLFQGNCFARAEVLRRRERSTGNVAALRLIAAVQDPTITIAELVAVANSDPTLAYRLLFLVNASASGIVHTVDSVHTAIVLLGIGEVRRLAMLLGMAGTASGNAALSAMAMARAVMAAELLRGGPEADAAFTVGMLSLIDVAFGEPMAAVLDALPLSRGVRDALLRRDGVLGEVLDLITACEQADLSMLRRLAPSGVDALQQIYGNAVVEADRLAGATLVSGR